MMVADDPVVPWWLRIAILTLLGGSLVVLVTVAVEQRKSKTICGLSASRQELGAEGPGLCEQANVPYGAFKSGQNVGDKTCVMIGNLIPRGRVGMAWG